MEKKRIETRLVQGFLDAGKTSFIQDCILNDYFHKYGSTLILCFEEGETEYDIEALCQRRTTVALYDGEEDISSFCSRMVEEHQPDRIYVEMNAMTQGLREALIPAMNITYICVWIEWQTMELYVRNMQQLLNKMVSEAHQITFRGCPSKDLLVPYSQLFRLMNHKATYLRQDPMGYHEKAFDLFVPWSFEDEQIMITQDNYLLFWLDAADHPQHYEGKKILFDSPMEIRKISSEYTAGRVVMTCCMADLQFMGFPLIAQNNNPVSCSPSNNMTALKDDSPKNETCYLHTGWFLIQADAENITVEYGRHVLALRPFCLKASSAPSELILTAQG